MIWFRRILTVPLIIICVALLVVILPISQLNDTAGNSKFYNDQLQKADVYNFIYDELMPTGLDELESGHLSDIPIDTGDIKQEIVSATRKTLPPDWIQEQLETALDTVLPYFLGDTDSFTLTVVLKDRVETAAAVIKEDIVRGEVFTDIYDDGMSDLAEELYENLDEMPYSVSLAEERIESALTSVFDREWIRPQLEEAVDSVTPYLTGVSDHFTITIYIGDRIDIAADTLIDLFGTAETYDYLVDELISPTIEASFGITVNLSFGISLTREEIASAVKEVLPLSWIRARLDDIVTGAAVYLKGETSDIEVTIDLGERKAVALNVIPELADDKLQSLFYSLPECSMAQFLYIVSTLPPNTLPDCRPSGVSYDEARELLDIDIAGSIDWIIGDRIPDQWIFTDNDLRELLGEGNEHLLDDARQWVSEGWTFSDTDLLDELESDQEETLKDVRGWINSGYTLTETDLREAISDTEEDLESFDGVRRWIDTARTWLWVSWLVFFILLFCIGVLGGRNWRSRLAWMFVILFVVSLTVYIATGLSYSRLGKPRIDDIRLDPSEYEGVAALVVEKGDEVIENVFDDFVSGMRGKTLYMFVGSGIATIAIVGWSVIGLRRGSRND
jgi:hypothetical protein